MDTPPTPPEDDARTLREVLTAVFAAVAVGTLVFLSVVGVVSLINGNKTLGAVQHVSSQNHALEVGASKFFKSVGAAVANFEHNEYVTCLAVHAVGCVPPPTP